MAAMTDASFLLLLAVASAGLLLVALVAVLVWRGRSVAAAFAQGQASREPEVVASARDREAATARAIELDQRLTAAEAERARLRERGDLLSDERAALAVKAERVEQAERLVEQLRGELQSTREVAVGEAARRVELETRLQEQQTATQRHLHEFDERLKAELAQLAQGVLEQRARQFDEHSERQLGSLLAPLREQLKVFAETVQRTNVEIVSLKQLNQQITTEAANLTRALKGDSRTQGAWGEQVLERLLELSGLQAGRGYELQVVFKGEDGSRPRPDVIVRLPDNKDLVIDAKVSLVAWDRALSRVDADPHEQAMKEHVGSLRRHIEGLGKRDYTTVPGLRTLDFVLMFVPVEAAFIEALRRDDALYGFALERNIALVSPSTLLATLRTVAHLWRMEDRNLNAQEIARQAGALHDSFVMLENDLLQVGQQMEKALRTHEAAVKRISTGRGNLVGRVDKLRRLGADTRRQLSEERFEVEEAESPDVAPALEGNAPDPAP